MTDYEHEYEIWTHEDTEKLLELKASGLSLTEIGNVMGRSYPSLQSRYQRLKRRNFSIPTPMKNFFSKEEDDTIINLWYEYTSYELAELMGRSRNAIIGRVHRLGIDRTKKPTIKKGLKPKATSKPRVFVQRNKEIGVAPKEIGVAPYEQPRTFAQLEQWHCKWPVGDPKEANFYFCGAPRKDDLPYCSYHALVAYKEPQERSVSPNAGTQAARTVYK